MLRQLVSDVKALLNGVISGGKVKVEGSFNVAAGATELTIDSNLSVPSSTPVSSSAIALTVASIGVQIENTGSGALSSFAVQARSNSNSAWITLADSSSDFTAPAFGSPLKGASGDLTALQATETGWFLMDVSYFTELRIQAGSAAATTLKIYAGGH